MGIKIALKELFYANPFVRKYYYLLTTDARKYIDQYMAALKNEAIDWGTVESDMKRCLLRYGCVYDEFFMFGLYKKTEQERAGFITDCKRYKYYRIFNSKQDDALFDDKWRTYLKLKDYYRRQAVLVREENDRQAFVAFALVHRKIIAKQLSLSCGNGIIFFDNIDSSDAAEAAFEELLREAPYIVEEQVVQSDYMKGLNPSSVNTIRINTIMTKDRTRVVSFFPFLKVGRGGMRVDNGGAGGILVGIDKDTGRLRSNGVDERGYVYESHPETGVAFCTVQLPQWEEALRLAEKLQRLFPNHRCTGWDLCHIDAGWVLIEGNSGGQFIGQQAVDQVGRRKELEELL